MSTTKKGILWDKVEKVVKVIDRHGITFVLILLALATALWMAGQGGPCYLSLPKAFYYSLQFIVLNRLVDETISSQGIRAVLYITQFAIPFFAYVTIFSKLFHERIYPFLKRKTVNSFSGHHVIVSYGAFGKALAGSLSDDQMVAIDKLHTAEHNGESTLTILYYDALRANLFKEANLKSAQAVYLMLPDERDNLTLLEKIKSDVSPNTKLKVFFRTQSFAMQNLLMDWVGINAFKHDGLDIHTSNPYAVAARGIVNCYSPDLYAPTMNGPVSQVVMVVGTSEMAKALVLHFARIGTYSPNGKLRLFWVGKGVTEALSKLRNLYPALDTDYSDLNYWSLVPGVPKELFDSILPPVELVLIDQPTERVIRSGTIAGADKATWPSAVYVCHDSDIRNLDEARGIQAALCSKPDASRIETFGKSARLILAMQNTSTLGIAENKALEAFPYRIEEQSIDKLFAETVVEDQADEVAKEYHAVYCGLKDETAINDAWIKLPVFWKESNRDLADHLAIKARYAGISAETVRDVVFGRVGSISEEDEVKMMVVFNDLVVMEIYRYRAFMFMNDFQYGAHASAYRKRMVVDQELPKPEKELNQCLRVNDTLLEMELPEEEREKDSNIVKKSIEVLKKKHLQNH